MGCQTEVALKSSAFSTLYEEGANLALFGVETHEHDLLATKPTEMKDWPHPGAYIILFRWKVKDDERPVWCLLLTGHRAKYNGQSGSNVRGRWYQHLAEALADVPKSRKAQAAKLADDMTGIVVYKVADPPAPLRAGSRSYYVPTVKEVNCAILLAVEAVHATILRTNQAHPGSVLFLNKRLGPPSPVIGLNTMLCLSSSPITSKSRGKVKKIRKAPATRQKEIIDAMKAASIHAILKPTIKTEEKNSIHLHLPDALLGIGHTPVLPWTNAEELGITESSPNTGVQVSLVERGNEPPPPVMGTISDARVLAKYAVVTRNGERSTELLCHRRYVIKSTMAGLLALIGKHAGMPPAEAVQRADLAPFELPNQALSDGRTDVQQPSPLVMGMLRTGVDFFRGSWKTTIRKNNGRTSQLIVPPPPPKYANVAKKGVLLDVVLAYDVDRDAVPYTYVRRDDKRPVTRAHGLVLRRPKPLKEAIFRCRAHLALEELEKDWSRVQKKPPNVQLDLALAGVFPLRISPTESSPAIRVCGERINAPRYLVRALEAEGVLTFRIDYEKAQLLW